MDWIFPGANTLVALADRVYQDDVRDAVLHARVLEPEADLALGRRKFFLAGDNVRVHDAGLFYPCLGGIHCLGLVQTFGQRPRWAKTSRGRVFSMVRFIIPSVLLFSV